MLPQSSHIASTYQDGFCPLAICEMYICCSTYPGALLHPPSPTPIEGERRRAISGLALCETRTEARVAMKETCKVRKTWGSLGLGLLRISECELWCRVVGFRLRGLGLPGVMGVRAVRDLSCGQNGVKKCRPGFLSKVL